MTPIRALYWVKRNKIRIFYSGITLCVILGVVISGYTEYTEQNKTTSTTFKNLQQIKVLILYSSGKAMMPHTHRSMTKDVDVITSPTPQFLNTAVIARMIANSLQKKMLQVALKEIGEIKKTQEVLFADVILIGSATHFWNMDWPTKRFFDETLYPVYLYRKTKLEDKYIGGFTTSEIQSSAEQCINSIYRALSDYGSKKLPSLIILNETPQRDVEKKVEQFAKELMVKLENAYVN